VFVHLQAADEYFTAGQRQRLEELKARWQAALDAGKSLPPDERAELDDLIFAELDDTTRRSAALLAARQP
jgi:hypothetical protein